MQSQRFFGQTLSIGIPGTGIVVGTVIPPVLSAYYATNYSGTVTQAWIGQYTGSGNYHYFVVMNSATLGSDIFAAGWVNTGGTNVVERYIELASASGMWHRNAPGFERFFNTQIQLGAEGPPYTNSDLMWDSTSLGRGLVALLTNATSTAGLASGASISPFTINLAAQPGRAYRLSWGNSATISAPPGLARVTINQTTSGGTLVYDDGNTTIGGTTGQHFSGAGYTRNNTAAVKNVALVFSITNNTAAASSFVWQGNGANPRFFMVEDCGAAVDYAQGSSL